MTVVANNQLSRGINSANTSLSKMGSIAGKAGKALAVGLGVGAAAFVAVGKEAVESLARIERINAQTAQTIKSTGGAAGVSAKHVEDLAGRLEGLTASEAEATQEGANMLLTFTGIRNEAGKGNKIFDQATRTLVDMSRALGSDPQKQAVQLGKALNDPIKGVSALSKVGVSFTDDQKKLIAGFVETGETAKAQKVILAELNKEFGGSGKAFAKTAAGQTELAKHAFGTLAETTFATVLPVLGNLATYITDALTRLNEYGPQIQAVFARVGDALKSAGQKVGQFFGFLSDNRETVAIVAAALGGAVGAVIALGVAVKAYTAIQIALNVAMSLNPIGLIVVAVGALIGVLALLYTKNETVRTTIQNLFGFFQTQVPPILSALQGLWQAAFARIQQIVTTVTTVVKALWAQFGTTIVSFLRNSMNNLKTIVQGGMQVIKNVIKLVTAVIKGDWKGAWDAIKGILSGVWKVIQGVVKQGINLAKTALSAGWTAAKNLTKSAWDGIKSAVSNAVSGLISTVKGIPGKIKSGLGNVAGILLQAGKDVVQGLINGIISMGGSLMSAITNLIKDKLPGPVKKVLGIKSPSRVFMKIGRQTMQGLLVGLQTGSEGLDKFMTKFTADTVKALDKRLKAETKALEKRMKKQGKSDAAIKKAVKALEKEYATAEKTFLKRMKIQGKALTAHARKVDEWKARQTSATQAVEDAKKAWDDYKTSVADSARNLGAITSLNSAFTVEGMKGALQERITQITKYTSLLKTLEGLKLDKGILDQLYAAGPEAGFAYAQALAAGGAAGVKEISDLQKQLDTAANALGTQGANAIKNSGITMAQAALDKINREGKQLEAAGIRIAQGFIRAINAPKPAPKTNPRVQVGGTGNTVVNQNIVINGTKMTPKEIADAIDKHKKNGGRRAA